MPGIGVDNCALNSNWSRRKSLLIARRRQLCIALVFLLLLAAGCHRNKQGAVDSNQPAANGGAPGDRSEAKVLLEQGKQLYRNDEDSKAVEAFLQAIKIDPDLAEPYFRLGLGYEALNKAVEAEDSYKKAVEAYKKYLDQNPKDAEAHYNLGQTYAGLRLYSEAVREYRQATKLKSDDSDIYCDLGLALTKLAQYDEAAAAFSKSLEIDPENYRAEDGLAEAKEGVQRIQAGKKHQQELLKKQKEDELKKQEEGTSSEAKPSGTKKP